MILNSWYKAESSIDEDKFHIFNEKEWFLSETIVYDFSDWTASIIGIFNFKNIIFYTFMIKYVFLN